MKGLGKGEEKGGKGFAHEECHMCGILCCPPCIEHLIIWKILYIVKKSQKYMPIAMGRHSTS